MSQRYHASQGFTAIELLVTLFIAAAFLATGYQLFSLIIKDSGETRAESSASNVAYDYLRRYSDSASNPCVPSTPLFNEAVAIDGVTSPLITISISCPQTDTPSVSKIQAQVTYSIGDTSASTKHATFVDKSKGATPSTDITDGLISWWKLNGNTSNSAGSPNLVDEGVGTATGQDGNPVGAYNFSNTNQNALIAPNYSKKLRINAFTITAWVYPWNNPTPHSGLFGIRDSTAGGVWALQLTGTNNLECRIQIASTAYQPTGIPALLPAQWQLISIVYDNGTLRCLRNSDSSSTVSGIPWWQFTSDNLDLVIGRTATYPAMANIDDVRVYSRALSSAELNQLRINGAR